MASHAPTKPVPLEPSPLGTKEYWDKLYTTELSNHASNPSDIGTIWFDDSSAEDKILAFLHSPELGLDLNTTSFLDLGTGNGHFLFRLRERWPPHEESDSDSDSEDHDDEAGPDNKRGEQYTTMQLDNRSVDITHDDNIREQKKKKKNITVGGFKGPMVGTDYSLPSINFANHLSSSVSSCSASGTSPPILFIHHDILHSPTSALLSALSPSPPLPQVGYDVVLDKGTFDAISLSSSSENPSRIENQSPSDPSISRTEDIYINKIIPLVRIGGCFLVTSCNWTREEVCAWFEGEEGKGKKGFRYVAEVEYPSFRFGGGKGQAVCSVCFRRVG